MFAAEFLFVGSVDQSDLVHHLDLCLSQLLQVTLVFTLQLRYVILDSKFKVLILGFVLVVLALDVAVLADLGFLAGDLVREHLGLVQQLLVGVAGVDAVLGVQTGLELLQFLQVLGVQQLPVGEVLGHVCYRLIFELQLLFPMGWDWLLLMIFMFRFFHRQRVGRLLCGAIHQVRLMLLLYSVHLLPTLQARACVPLLHELI